MKCPKCGFVNYPGTEQCKKCGRWFHQMPRKERFSPFSFLFSKSTAAPSPVSSGSQTQPVISPTPPHLRSVTLPAEVHEAPVQATETAREPVIQTQRGATQAASDWRQEVSGRVQDFRRRRARLRGFDPESSLSLDFDIPQARESENAVGAKVIEFPHSDSNLDFELGGLESALPVLDSHPLEKSAEGMRVLSSAAVQAGEAPLDQADAEPVEILVEPTHSPAQASPLEVVSIVLHQAPLRRRFLAGVADGLVLLLAAGFFALILWLAGGRISLEPLNVVVLGAIAVFFILVYFGLFTTLAGATPGLLWMGLEVRSLEGNLPTPKESFWRAFGCLVSIAALLLGFIWALVDSDHLTWHDRMSRTFVTVRD